MTSLGAHTPIVALSGSFFPVWLFAAIGGVLVAVLLRQIFILIGLHTKLPLAPFFYSAVALLVGVGSYVIWIGGYQG